MFICTTGNLLGVAWKVLPAAVSPFRPFTTVDVLSQVWVFTELTVTLSHLEIICENVKTLQEAAGGVGERKVFFLS